MFSYESTCSSSCGRLSMETIYSGRSKSDFRDICASNGPSTAILGSFVKDQKRCSGSKSDKSETHCLCSDDGETRGSDFSWVAAKSKGRCDTACSKKRPLYGFAVYGRFVGESWQHLCRAPDNSIGSTGAGIVGCATESGIFADFQCICTQSFAGDLDKKFDP